MDKYELERIYDLYFEIVYRICFLYMKNPADAQNVTQETIGEFREEMSGADSYIS